MLKKKAQRESRKRAADSGRTLVKAGLGLAASFAIGPAGGLAVVALDRLWEHTRGVVSERRQKRVKRFHEELLAGMPEGEQRTLLGRMESEADAAAEWARILEQVWADDEEEKTGIYARLLRLLLSGVPDGPTRRHLVRSVRQLAASDIELLKTARHLGDSWPEPMTGSMQLSPEFSLLQQAHFRKQMQFLHDGDPLKLSGIQRLEHSGFIKLVPVWGGDKVGVTPLGRQLLEAVE